MNRLIVQLGRWSTIVLFAAIAATWHFAFRDPVRNILPLPHGLISVGSPGGRAYIDESDFVADYPSLIRAFTPQSRRSFSGVASAVMVLNALRGPESSITESSFFNDPVKQIRGSFRVSFSGLTLTDVRDMLRAHGADAEAYYAADTDINAFRALARENLARAGDYLLVNYPRDPLLQKGSENIAPVAAYHGPTDRILVVDVAVAHYPPVWVTVEAIWNAMSIIDRDAPRGRGFVVVREHE